MKKYGKPSAGILGVGQTFFAENDASLEAARRHAQLYVAQPVRVRCKLCDGTLPGSADFRKLSVPYASCRRCGHLNGLHEDTDAFCEALYLDASYATYYASADAERYRYRVDAVYRPKVAFLEEALRSQGVDFRTLRYADFGAGSGYFVAALASAGVADVLGLEVSPEQVAFANRMLPGDRLRLTDLRGTLEQALSLTSDVVSLIGVLEHLQDPRAFLRALRQNPAPKYLFLVLPLFGLCVFLEMAFPNVYPRHLVSDHTHLFTMSSIAWMQQEFGLSRVAEWWFGSDMIDLYREVSVMLSGNDEQRSMTDEWALRMQPLIDPMQLAIDRMHLGSEVHLLLRIERAQKACSPQTPP